MNGPGNPDAPVPLTRLGGVGCLIVGWRGRLLYRWVGTPSERSESPSLWRRLRIDPVPHPMDHDMVMEPTEGGEVVRIVVAALEPLADVVRLEPIP